MSEEIKNENESQSEGISEKKRRKIEKAAEKDRKSEIKSILLGNMTLDTQGNFNAGGSSWVTPFGIADGASETIMFGVKHKRYLYKTDYKNNQQAIYKASKTMSDIGRTLSLATVPNAAACYIKHILFRPVVLVFEEAERSDGSKGLELHAYSGRALLTFISIRRAVSKFNKELPEEIKRVQ